MPFSTRPPVQVGFHFITAEEPASAGYVEAEMQILGWMGKPVLLLLNQMGAPRGRVDTNWQFFTNASYNTGKHNLKWGYEFRRTTVNGFFDAGQRGVLVFDSFDNFLAGSPGGGSGSL